MATSQSVRLDVADLQQRVQDVYRQVAQEPHRSYHFEMGRALAARLGYPTELLDLIPAEALDSFAGVGYFLDLADPQVGDRVLDLGSAPAPTPSPWPHWSAPPGGSPAST